MLWDGKNTANEQVSSGVYIVKLMYENKSLTKKIILSK